jgi:hypothetical protein
MPRVGLRRALALRRQLRTPCVHITCDPGRIPWIVSLTEDARMTTRTSILAITHGLSVTMLLVVGAGRASAADWPTFKPGQWSFERTMEGPGAPTDKITMTECTDPTAFQNELRATLTKAGCQFTPLAQSGKTYRYSATCKMGGMTSKSDSVLEFESAEAYTLTVDSTVDGKKSHEVLRARRTGDCKK